MAGNLLGYEVTHRLIMSAHQGLNRVRTLMDDYDSGSGQEYFEGKWSNSAVSELRIRLRQVLF